ncbi:facilitated trehalose transporter Tret1-like [Ostrinia furnacalis]|uniref:facilitated trehalose transporter Tret1-like n=1 Tax=Ostrinia furnacalis TaxID=93504 RepID=UPI00103BF44C|nr:facilitated trehalose transporter Tret1-like [Ostrinia furnacalis]
MYQTLTALACSLGSMCLGSLMVWPSYTLPMLAASNNTILSAPLTGAEEAMLGSLPAAGAAVGAAVMGCYDTFGRKRASLVMTLLFAISWCTIGMTSSIMVVLMARFLGGFAGGATMVVNPVYIAEVVEDGSRGILASGNEKSLVFW